MKEVKLWCLLPGYDDESRLEASGILARDGRFHVIFDSDATIASIDASLVKTPHNRIVRIVGRPYDNYGFEDITYNDHLQRYYTLIETCRYPDGGFRPQIVEYTAGFDYLETCWVNVPFEKENKGLEGIVYLARDDIDYVLGLCEGNRCRGGKEGRKPGGGCIHVLRKLDGAWQPITAVALPKSLLFEDYASMAMLGDRLAIISQELQQLWVGNLAPDRWEIIGDGTVYNFPTGKKQSRSEYCNLEGISWLDDTTLVAVSDRGKKDKRHDTCVEHEQSIHKFKLPEAARQTPAASP